MTVTRKPSSRKALTKVAKAAFDTGRPLLAQIVITEKCNLSCGYCFEYDKKAKPVPMDVLTARIDELKRLKVGFITLNGGEPLLHPNIVSLVAYIHDQGMIPMINSNGWLLTEEMIIALDNAGLFGIQLSCDGLYDNDITKKSFTRLQPKLELLQKHAGFKVRVNGVLGSGTGNEVLTVAEKVLEFGFDFQCSLMRDQFGATLPIDQETRDTYLRIRKLRGRLPALLHDSFQLPLVNNEEVQWKCRSGARYFHVDSKGLVHLCQPRTGTPAKRLEDYTREDIKYFFNMEKTCSAKCPHAYAHIGSRMDKFRTQKGSSCMN